MLEDPKCAATHDVEAITRVNDDTKRKLIAVEERAKRVAAANTSETYILVLLWASLAVYLTYIVSPTLMSFFAKMRVNDHHLGFFGNLLNGKNAARPDRAERSAHPRLVKDGDKLVPSKNPRYLQRRPDLLTPVNTYMTLKAIQLLRKIKDTDPLFTPANAVLSGRRNNPPHVAKNGMKLLPPSVFAPQHYVQMEELLMEYITSMTGASPSIFGAGSEGALLWSSSGPSTPSSTTPSPTSGRAPALALRLSPSPSPRSISSASPSSGCSPARTSRS